jgi:hypothetical protein
MSVLRMEENMVRKDIVRFIGLLVVVLTLVSAACAGGATTGAPELGTGPGQNTAPVQNNGDAVVEPAAPEATLTAAEMFPDTLVIHPDAMNIDAKPASGTYVYIVPMLVQETTDYLLAEMMALGWEELGKPTVMGHLATINLQMGKTRVTISMQDNERSQTTRVQMVLLQQR